MYLPAVTFKFGYVDIGQRSGEICFGLMANMGALRKRAVGIGDVMLITTEKKGGGSRPWF